MRTEGGNLQLPVVSIVIPVYNGSNYLRQAIDSALAQTYSAVETIVVNDGSKDSGATREIALSYGDKIRYLEKPNGGVASALNMGIQEMNGTLFSWLSHDDLYYPEKLEKQVAFYLGQSSPRVVVFSHEDTVDAHGAILRRTEPFVINQALLCYRLLYDRFIGGCSLLVPKSAFDEAGYFDPKYITVQDYDMWFRLIAIGYDFKYLPVASGMCRKHEEQDSRKLAALCQKEQDEYFVKVQEWLPAARWIEKFDDIPKAFYALADNFEQIGLRGVARYDIARGDAAAKEAGPARRIDLFAFRSKVVFAARLRGATKNLRRLKATMKRRLGGSK